MLARGLRLSRVEVAGDFRRPTLDLPERGEAAVSTKTLARRLFRQTATLDSSTGAAARFVRFASMTRGWWPLVVLPAAVGFFFSTSWPRWVLMWTLALVIYSGCKWLTWRQAPIALEPTLRHLAYLLAWPGMDAAAFLDRRLTPACKPRAGDWLFAAAKLVVGASVLLWAVVFSHTQASWVVGWIGMVGVVLILHFGVFDVLSLAWRGAGIDARPLMDWPLASTSLGEFWGRRWNTAFRDLAFRFVFRVAASAVGPRAAIAVVFILSGLVHEMVISVPAAAGYGGPTLFFTAQAGGLFVQRSRFGRKIGLGRGGKGWLFTMLVLITPLPLLFPPAFVTNVIVPMLRTMEVTS